MTILEDTVGAEFSSVERPDGRWSTPSETLSRGEPDWRSLFERERARADEERGRADAAEARSEELRWSDVDARSRAGSLKWQLDTLRKKLKAAVEETKEVRRTAKDALFFQAEVARLTKLVSNAGVDAGKRGTISSRRKAGREAEARKNTAKSREASRLRKALETEQAQKDRIKSLRREMAGLRTDLREAEKQKGTIRALSKRIEWLQELLGAYQDQKDRIRVLSWQVGTLSEEVGLLRPALKTSKEEKKALASRVVVIEPQLVGKDAQLRAALRRSRGQKKTIKSQSREIGRLRKALRSSKTHREALAVRLAKLRATGAVLSKRLFGRKSEKQETPRSERRRGQQPGAAGHGRTQRPALDERTEVHNPPAHERVCACCGKAYAANGDEVSTIVEIHVAAHKRVIHRPRWRRTCTCTLSPRDVSAPPAPRLFARTPYGISVWARFLFERYACFRPINRVAAWLSDQGLPISPGTLGDSVVRFLPLFEPLSDAILVHQNEATLRHGDETSWRVQSLRESGRSSRAWLWTSVSIDAVSFHIDPSRSAEAAARLFGDAAPDTVLVCDRYSAYKKLARDLAGMVVLAWCWSHVRRDFIECAAGEAPLTEWCQGWIERIASIYRLNETRLVHYDPGRKRQTEAFAAAQVALEVAIDDLFAGAEKELAVLPAGAREGKALRSLVNHREGLCVFVDRPQVPMDNNFAERMLRGPTIGRRLSFGSDSETGALFTARMYSIIGTLALNGIDVRRWLEAWLEACAANGGPPPDLSPWLPWSMSEKRRRGFTAPG